VTHITLCQDWALPSYAQPHITVNTQQQQQLHVNDAQGNITLNHTPDVITVAWHRAPLTQLQWGTTPHYWDGSVRLGGFVTAIHFTHIAEFEVDLAIMTVEAYPLKPTTQPYQSAANRAQAPYAPTDCLDGIDDTQPEGVTTWIADIDSPLVGLMQDAMNQAHRIYVFGQLADEEQGWHHLFALPILLESVTTFMR
jgi:hypothetical protein